MSATRNKNTQGDYRQERLENIHLNVLNKYTGKTANEQTFLPGNGLLTGRMGHSQLSYNGCDIESQLLGIGSTNLETPTILSAPSLKQMKSLSIIDRLPVFLPEPLIISKTERNMYLN
jgi:hypothetical protein